MTEKMIRDAYCRIRTIDQTIPDDVLDFMKDAALEKLRKHVQEIKDASPSRHQEGDMKTLQEIKDEVAVSCGYVNWDELSRDEGAVDSVVELVAKRYAQQAGEQVRKDAAERAVFIHHCGRTKRNKPLKYIQLGCDNIHPDKQSILETEIKLP